MEPDSNFALIENLKDLKQQGWRSSDILRFLNARGITVLETMFFFRKAFGLDFWDIACIGGWFSDGSGELDDDAVNSLLDPAIARTFSSNNGS